MRIGSGFPAGGGRHALCAASGRHRYRSEKSELLDPNRNDNWAYAMGKILCIGDSLTEGTYFGAGMDGAAIEQNYPYYLGRMLNTEVVNAGVGGYSASDWYIEKAGDYDYTDYNLARHE